MHTIGGPGLVHLHEAGGLTPAHDLLARDRRVVAIAISDAPDAAAMLEALSGRRIDEFDLVAAASAAPLALRMALAAPERVRALVLESPDRDPELDGALPGVQVPVLVVVGTRDPRDTGRACKRLLPNCQLLYVYDAGHAVAADRPEAFTEAVGDFLDRHEQYVVSRRSGVLLP